MPSPKPPTNGAAAVPVAGLLATDLDGTLLRADGSVSDYTRAMLRAARDCGFPVVFVTGRPPRWIDIVTEATGHTGTVIASNGGVVLDTAHRTISATYPFDVDVLDDLIGRLTHALPDASYAVEYVPHGEIDDPSAFGRSPEYVGRLDPPDDATTARVHALVRLRPVIKLLLRGTMSADALLSAAVAAVGDRAEVTHSNTADTLLEIMTAGVTKGSTLAAHAATHGLGPGDVVTVGDMPNDLSMLTWADRSYAISDGHPDAISAAHDTVGPPTADGVATLLERLLDDYGRADVEAVS